MTGRELINWIVDFHAEDMDIVVQYRDGGGNYIGGEIVNQPILANVRSSNIPYPDGVIITYGGLPTNGVIL